MVLVYPVPTMGEGSGRRGGPHLSARIQPLWLAGQRVLPRSQFVALAQVCASRKFRIVDPSRFEGNPCLADVNFITTQIILHPNVSPGHVLLYYFFPLSAFPASYDHGHFKFIFDS